MTIVESTAIKNLSIAYEALSRCAGAEDFLDRVNSLLDRVLREAEKEQTERENPVHTYTPPPRPSLDDEAPF